MSLHLKLASSLVNHSSSPAHYYLSLSLVKAVDVRNTEPGLLLIKHAVPWAASQHRSVLNATEERFSQQQANI